MASVAPGVVVLIRRHILVVIFQLILVIMAIQAIVDRKIASGGVAFAALVPLVVVLPAVDREVHIVMVKIRRFPGILRMARRTVRREARRLVIRIVRPGVLRLVTAVASGRRIVVIPVVTGGTVILDADVRTLERPKLVVNREGRRVPIW